MPGNAVVSLKSCFSHKSFFGDIFSRFEGHAVFPLLFTENMLLCLPVWHGSDIFFSTLIWSDVSWVGPSRHCQKRSLFMCGSGHVWEDSWVWCPPFPCIDYVRGMYARLFWPVTHQVWQGWVSRPCHQLSHCTFPNNGKPGLNQQSISWPQREPLSVKCIRIQVALLTRQCLLGCCFSVSELLHKVSSFGLRLEAHSFTLSG